MKQKSEHDWEIIAMSDLGYDIILVLQTNTEKNYTKGA